MASARLPCDYRAYEHARAQAQETDMPSNDDQEPAPARSAGSLEGLRQKGLHLRSQGMHEGAAEAFAELLSQHPHDARGHVDLAISLRAMGQPGEAIKILGGALDNACSVSFRRPCILQIARCHRALGNLDSARSYLEEALRLSADEYTRFAGVGGDMYSVPSR